MRRLAAAGLLATLLSACAVLPPTVTIDAAGRRLAAVEGKGAPIDGVPSVRPLVVVIEGDGRAHDRAGRPTRDPTPAHAEGLAIARAWPGGAAWLGRPCQFIRARDPLCRPEDWTVERFSAGALAAAHAGVETLKRRAGASSVVLVGWSGGGVIAAALARRRGDVAGLVTLAAPLDVADWTMSKGLSPLVLAPEVAGLATAPLALPQVHLYGARDRIVPADRAVRAARALGPAAVVAVENQAHACCWDRAAVVAAARLEALSPSAGR